MQLTCCSSCRKSSDSAMDLRRSAAMSACAMMSTPTCSRTFPAQHSRRRSPDLVYRRPVYLGFRLFGGRGRNFEQAACIPPEQRVQSRWVCRTESVGCQQLAGSWSRRQRQPHVRTSHSADFVPPPADFEICSRLIEATVII